MSAEVNPASADAVSPATIEETIVHIDRLYRTLTGHEPPSSDAPYAPIPAEKDPARHVEEQLDRLLSLLGPASGAPATPQWAPPASLLESEREAVICLDVPGVSRGQLEVRLHGQVITVAGQRHEPQQDHELRLRANERPLGRFHRTLPLPHGGNAAAVTARLREGVLEIRIPREVNQASTTRNVPVE